MSKRKKRGSKTPSSKKPSQFDKYVYYENSVQTPEEQVNIFDRIYKETYGRDAITLKEDFCGTFLISCEWVKSRSDRKAIGIDLDPETLKYGREHGYTRLAPSEKKRITLLEKDVCIPTQEKVDLICAGNFSFFIFKTREQMITYFKAAFKSLAKEGVLVLEMAGGPGFIRTSKEQRTYRVKGLGKYKYYWDQKSFDPITANGVYAIHFRTKDGVLHKDCFVYDWRVWSIPELRELLIEAGFKDAVVYWEGTDRHGQGTGEYIKSQSGDNAYSWIAFVVGIK